MKKETKATQKQAKIVVYQHLGVALKCWLTLKSSRLLGELFSSGVNQLQGVNQHLRGSPNHWQTPLFECFVQLCLIFFSSVSDGKICFSVKKLISTSKRHEEHPFAGPKTQQLFVPQPKERGKSISNSGSKFIGRRKESQECFKQKDRQTKRLTKNQTKIQTIEQSEKQR